MVRVLGTAILASVLTQRISAIDLENGMGKEITVPAKECAAHFIAGGALCGEIVMPCAVAAPMMALMKDFKIGRCKDVTKSLKQIDTMSFAGVNLTSYVGNFAGNDDMSMGLTVPARECAIHLIAGGALCGEVAMPCLMKAPTKALLKDFKDGYCGDFGKTIKQIDTKTIAGVNITAYVGIFASNNDTSVGLTESKECAVHLVVGPALCGDVTMNCALEPFVMELLKDFEHGRCVDVGDSIKQIDTHSFADINMSAYIGNFVGNVKKMDSQWPPLPGFHCTAYDEAKDYGIPCGEVYIRCEWLPLIQLLRPFQQGKCSDVGYAVQTHEMTVPFTLAGNVTFTMYDKIQPSKTRCKVSLSAGVVCAQLESTCDLIPALKDFVGFEDGECSANSFKEVPGTTGPVMEGQDDVIFTAFIDRALPVPEISGRTCSIWDEGDAFAARIGIPCGEIQLDCSLVEHAKTLRESFKDGVCADGGYTKNKMSHTFWVPLAGDVVMTIFDEERELLI